MPKKLAALCVLVALCTGPQLASAQSGTDLQTFATKAASSNTFEIQSSELALDHPVRDDVKAFAQQMIEDHTAAGEKMEAAAKKDGVPVPTALAPAEQAEMDKLQGTADDAFEAAYVSAQAKAHDEAVELFASFSQEGPESALKTFAGETLPTLQMHQTEAHKLMQ
jgi:putative membrane protein